MKKRHPSITDERVLAAAEDNMIGLGSNGFCLACGEDADGVEPDAQCYDCESCGEAAVCGADELLF